MTWDIQGKTVLITGATSGIGLAAARDLARRGAHVIIVGRDAARTEAAAMSVKAAAFFLCDFSSLSEIRRVAAEIRARHDRIDVLVNNAGGVNKTRRVSADGYELTFATNHLGYFLLTNLLLDAIVRSAPARIVTVASIGHRQGTLDFDDLHFERGRYGIMRAYSRSKLANVLFAKELARRLAGTGVTSNSLHPGSVDTRIWSGAPWWAKPIIQTLFRPFFITAEQGASYVVNLVANPELSNITGRYFEEGTMMEPSRLGRDEALARRLWEVSEQLTRPTHVS